MSNPFKKSKRDYFNDLNVKKVCDNKNVWKVVKPLFYKKQYFK